MDNREPTRVRENGRMVTRPANGLERIHAFREILRTKTAAKIDGTLIDSVSANCVVKVYDALNEANKRRFQELPAPRMALLAFKLTK